MGYLKIPNLYKNRDVLSFKQVYALEKVHGTSAHVTYKPAHKATCSLCNGDGGKSASYEYGTCGPCGSIGSVTVPESLTFFSGGESHVNFVALFDRELLLTRFRELDGLTANTSPQSITVYGEAYGGKQQGMSHTYGTKLHFIAFDVQVGDTWLQVPSAERFCQKLEIEFVPYVLVNAELSALDEQRDAPSQVAMRRGLTEPKMREGIVIRPMFEALDSFGERVIAKHKGEKFSERASTPKVVDAGKAEILADARKIADEWVVYHRLEHVLGKLELDGLKMNIQDTKRVIEAMVEDVYTEGRGEVVESKEARNAIGTKTAQLFKQLLNDRLRVSQEG